MCPDIDSLYNGHMDVQSRLYNGQMDVQSDRLKVYCHTRCEHKKVSINMVSNYFLVLTTYVYHLTKCMITLLGPLYLGGLYITRPQYKVLNL